MMVGLVCLLSTLALSEHTEDIALASLVPERGRQQCLLQGGTRASRGAANDADPSEGDGPDGHWSLLGASASGARAPRHSHAHKSQTLKSLHHAKHKDVASLALGEHQHQGLVSVGDAASDVVPDAKSRNPEQASYGEAKSAKKQDGVERLIGQELGPVKQQVQKAVEDLEEKTARTVEAKRAESHQGAWDYETARSWSSKYFECEGERQSPINIQTARVNPDSVSPDWQLTSRLRYQSVPGKFLEVENNGHSIKVSATQGSFGCVMLPCGSGACSYCARQFHFHVPSEHAVNNLLASGELHIVHERHNDAQIDKQPQLAVIAIMLQDRDMLSADIMQEAVWRQLGFFDDLGLSVNLPASGQQKPVEKSGFAVNLFKVFEEVLEGPYFHYQGSLTTPPCSQTVHWYVMERPAAVNKQMLTTYKDLFSGPTNRQVQADNGRDIEQNRVVLSPAEYPPVVDADPSRPR